MKTNRLFAFILALLASGSVTPGRVFAAAIELFPTPVSAVNTLFPALGNQVAVDDSTVQVAFTQGFSFPFYGSSYTSVHLNTNGGLTFASGSADWNLAATSVTQPAIAVFWGDMDAGAAAQRSAQMSYEQFADRFVVRFAMIQDHDNANWNNSATLTLYRDGGINIAYGTVGSQDILAGIFSGTHGSDAYPGLQNLYADYTTLGSSLILFDEFGAGPTHTGELNGRSLYFSATGNTYPVTVGKTGSGSVSSTPGGIDCGAACTSATASFASASTVSLSASAAAGSYFQGWTGACNGTGSCTLTMDSTKEVYALFIDGGVPSAPGIKSITPGPGRLTIHFDAPGYSGNSPITAYTATCRASGHPDRTATGSASPLIVSGLAGNVPYSCSLVASNAEGSSAASTGVVATPRRLAASSGSNLLLLLD